MTEKLDELKQVLTRARAEVEKVIIGQRDAVEKCLMVILTRNHALIEGVPGVAKTLMVRTFSQVLGGAFARIQFTPDLMPADITGTNVFNLQRNEFTLIPGPIFCTFLLADEINRAPAKTQSALLQAMQEHAVTIDRETHTLPSGFTVFATQNPIEFEGTYPLPEAQKDRFMLKIGMSFPARDEELALASRMLGRNAPEATLASGAVQCVLAESNLDQLRDSLTDLIVKDELIAYIVDVVRKARSHEAVLVGCGPRATQALLAASRASAALDGRDYVTPDDVKSLAGAVLEHRLILRPEYEVEGMGPAEVVASVLKDVPVPR